MVNQKTYKVESSTNSSALIILTGGLFFGLLLTVGFAWFASNTNAEIIDSKIELVANELDIEVSEVVISDDGQTFSTEDGEYRANFEGNKTKLELRTLVKLKEVSK